jgi:glutathione S-transferase
MGVDYELTPINPLAGETQTEEYLKMSPAGKVPALDDDGFTVFESNSIMRYLCRKHKSDFYPDDIAAQAKIDEWLDFTTIHLGNGIVKVLFNKIVAGMIDAPVDEQSMADGYSFIERFLGVIDQQLGNSTYLAGESLSIADFCLLATIDPAEVLEIDMNKYPNVKAWRDKLMQESFYKKMHNSYAEMLKSL